MLLAVLARGQARHLIELGVVVVFTPDQQQVTMEKGTGGGSALTLPPYTLRVYEL